MAEEYVEKRFGVIAVQKGFVTVDQVMEALKVQLIEDMENKRHRFLGTILAEQGYVNHAQINEVLKAMSIHIPI